MLQRVLELVLFAVGLGDAEEQLVSCSWQPGGSFRRTGGTAAKVSALSASCANERSRPHARGSG